MVGSPGAEANPPAFERLLERAVLTGDFPQRGYRVRGCVCGVGGCVCARVCIPVGTSSDFPAAHLR